MTDKLRVLREMILDTDREMWEDDTLQEVLEESGSLYDAAAVFWNMVASSKNQLEFYFGSFHTEDFGGIFQPGGRDIQKVQRYGGSPGS